MLLAATAAAVLSLSTPVSAGPSRIQNARIENRSAGSGLAPAVKGELASRPGPFWIGWSVATSLEKSACCWSSYENPEPGCRGCRLEGQDGFVAKGEAAERLEGPPRVRVLLRAERGTVGRIRALSEDCPIDAGGLAFAWLEDVRPTESIALLASFVGEAAKTAADGEELEAAAIMAIAFHADASADAALARLVAVGQPLEVRKHAAFWMGQERGEAGYRALRLLVRGDPDPRLREHAIFALSQSREPAAVDTIIEAARTDEDAEVRGQALFWLAQAASRRAQGAIREALEADPEIGVKKQAVFALSQLPKDEGLPLLIELARGHRSREVREQAMFWLGESRDPRALAFFEGVLGR